MISLEELKGIRSRQIKALQENGINSIESLAMTSPDHLSDINGISDKSGKQLVWGAREILGLGCFKKVSEIEENFEYITTGSENLDQILTSPGTDEGGVSTGRITEVFGAFKTGKTNLSHTLCVTTQLPRDQGGLGGTVLFIDTENTFSKKKVSRIARRFGQSPETILANIYHARIYSSDHQIQMIRAAEAAIQNKNAKLVIVDSLMALLRAEYIGIGLLARRQQVLNQIIHDLSRLAETYNVAVLVTNQVATQMKGHYSADDAIGGNIVAHGCHFRLQFKSRGFSANSSLEREAIIVDAPDLPPESAKFFITEAGIADTEDIKYPEIEKSKSKKKSKKKSKAEEEFELVSAADSDDGDEEDDNDNSDFDQEMIQEFEEETGKNAIWQGSITKAFKEWLKEQ